MAAFWLVLLLGVLLSLQLFNNLKRHSRNTTLYDILRNQGMPLAVSLIGILATTRIYILSIRINMGLCTRVGSYTGEERHIGEQETLVARQDLGIGRIGYRYWSKVRNYTEFWEVSDKSLRTSAYIDAGN